MSKLQKVHGAAAGIDIGSCKFFVGTAESEVQNFDTFTSGCHQVVEYLQQKNIKSVAMEATGVYWITLYDMLVAAGIEVYVVNGRHVKHVPGRKTDVQDCLWIKELHSYGLLRSSFIPRAEILQVRHYMRIREKDIENKVAAVQRMDKALVMMNIRLSSVVSAIQSVSVMKIIEAILAGEHNAKTLAALCDVRIQKNKEEEILKSLEGFYKEEQLYALQHAYDEYKFYENKIKQCDAKIEVILKSSVKDKEAPKVRPTGKRVYHHRPDIAELDKMMIQLYDGKDLTILPGLTCYSVLKFYSVIGNDFSAWRNEKAFTAYLGLAPTKYQTGKSRKYRKIKTNTEGGQILKECVQPLLRSKHNALGAFGKRISGRRGASIAIKAMARKLAVWIYNIVTKGMAFVNNGIEQYEEQLNKRKIKWLEKQAKELNLMLTPC
jgi:transposase